MIGRISCILLSLLFLTGCGEAKREEALATIVQADCEKTGISFQLNGLWELEDKENKEGTGIIELSAKNRETDAHILVYYEELKDREGGEVFRTDDYIENIIENLKISEEYDYSIMETKEVKLFNKNYITFMAKIPSMEAIQQFYIHKGNEIITVMVITSYGQEEISEILSYCSKAM